MADSGDIKPVRHVALRYPSAAREARVEARFFTVAVLDTAGRVEMPSVTFLGAAPEQFRGAVCDYYRKEVFTPVVRDHQMLRALVVSPWSFAIQGSALEGKYLDERGVRNAIKVQGVVAYIPHLDASPHCTR